jgi:uncharacterized protein (DUF983 family)
VNRGLIATALKRGMAKRCPHCGVGPLFAGWAHHLRQCSHCGLVFEPNAGDTWAFTIIGDRLPLGLLVILVYFGVFRANRPLGVATFILIGILFVLTSPNRWGAGIALHYLSRMYWPDPDDPIPGGSRPREQ